jgi:hypothetical protein
MAPPINTRGDYATLAAAGTTQATAAECTADMVMVTSGSNAAGVLIRPLNLKEEQIVCNGTGADAAANAADIFVYPRSGGSINNQTANTPILIAAGRAVRFRAINGAGAVIAFF